MSAVRLGALAAMAAGLLACEPAIHMRGRVREPAPCGDAETAASALPAAKIDVVCPPQGEDPVLSAVSSPTGSFDTGRIGQLSLDCSVRVTKAGYAPRTYSVRDLCATYHDRFESCFSFSLEALLERAPMAAAP